MIRQTSKLVLFSLVFVWGVDAQMRPSPVPVSELEVKENSIKMRARTLALIKRNRKNRTPESIAEQKARLAVIKKDFEQIQVFQGRIVKAYTEKQEIDYRRIAELSLAFNRSTVRLAKALFSVDLDKEPLKQVDPSKLSAPGLIVLIDKSLTSFVENPLFENTDVVDIEASKKAQISLSRLHMLTSRLHLHSSDKRK